MQLCNCIREFKEKSKVDKVVVLWTANTERYSDVIVGLNDTQENLFKSLDRDESEISPSTLYALACIHENVPFINGSPQNTFVPGKKEANFYAFTEVWLGSLVLRLSLSSHKVIGIVLISLNFSPCT